MSWVADRGQAIAGFVRDHEAGAVPLRLALAAGAFGVEAVHGWLA